MLRSKIKAYVYPKGMTISLTVSRFSGEGMLHLKKHQICGLPILKMQMSIGQKLALM